MDSKNMNTFIQVAELHSFTKAAEKLGYTQSTVSFQIKQLESELGTTLFDRINHTITLTDQGRQLLETVHKINRLLRDFQMNLTDPSEISGHVKIVMATSLCSLIIGSVFPKLHSKYPGITLEIVAAGTEDMFRMLNQNEADLVYTLDSHIYNTNYYILAEKQISAHFVCSVEHPLAGSVVPLEELVKEPFLLTERNMSYRKVLDEKLAAKSMEITPILESGSTSLITSLVLQNYGISFLPDYSTKPYLQEGKMAIIHVSDLEVEVWTQLLIHRDKWASPQIKIVMDLLREATMEVF